MMSSTNCILKIFQFLLIHSNPKFKNIF